jgi:hypothetical protein
MVVASDTASLHREAGSLAIHPVDEFPFAEPTGPGAMYDLFLD